MDHTWLGYKLDGFKAALVLNNIKLKDELPASKLANIAEKLGEMVQFNAYIGRWGRADAKHFVENLIVKMRNALGKAIYTIPHIPTLQHAPDFGFTRKNAITVSERVAKDKVLCEKAEKILKGFGL
jgi:hypothetical protein